MSSLSRAALLFPLTAACIEPRPEQPPVTHTVSVARTPLWFAYRDGEAGEWQIPAPAVPGVPSYSLDVRYPYVVVVVCEDQGSITTHQVARTPDDPAQLSIACDGPPLTPATLRGTMVQAGAFAVGSTTASSKDPDWPLELVVEAGTYDLIGAAADRIAIRRGVAIQGDVEIEPMDVAAGSAFGRVAVSAVNSTAFELVEAFASIATPTTHMDTYLGSPSTVAVAPSELLAASDEQRLGLTASTATRTRTAWRPFRAGSSTAFALPPIFGVRFEAAADLLRVEWTDLPEHDSLSLAAYAFDVEGHAHSYEVTVTSSFREATGALKAAFAAGVPGYRPAWRPDLDGGYVREVRLTSRHGEDRFESTAFETVNFGDPNDAARAASRLLTRGRRAIDREH